MGGKLPFSKSTGLNVNLSLKNAFTETSSITFDKVFGMCVCAVGSTRLSISPGDWRRADKP